MQQDNDPKAAQPQICKRMAERRKKSVSQPIRNAVTRP